MNNEIYGVTTFCEDIRIEQDDKITLVGVFTQGIWVDELPATLPKFGIYINLVVPHREQVSMLKTRLYLPGEKIDKPFWASETDLSDAMRRQQQLAKQEDALDDSDVDMVCKFDQEVLFSPVIIKVEGYIKVRVEIAGRLVKVGTIRVEKTESTLSKESEAS